MAYTGKTNWQLNEIVKPEDMNRIEQGIIDAYESLLTHNKSADAHKNRFDEFVKGVTGSNATLTIIAIKAIKDKIAPAKWVNPLIGSLMKLFITNPPNFII